MNTKLKIAIIRLKITVQHSATDVEVINKGEKSKVFFSEILRWLQS